MKTTINITQRDIDFGVPQEPETCAVARAIQRRLRTKYSVSIGFSTVGLHSSKTKKLMFTRDLALKARDFIRDFDSAPDLVKPCRFELDIPSKYLKK